jgi:membrane fusion protein (multidrug efflux system)
MAETNEPAVTENKKMTVKTIIIRVIIGLAVATGLFFGGKKIIWELHHESTDNAQIEANLVPILPRVSGYIKTIYPEDYATVRKDSLLVEIDDADLQLQLAEMKADLAQAQTDIGNAHAAINNTGASIVETQSNLDVAQTRKDKAHTDYTRDQGLFRDGAITKRQLDDSKANVDIADRQYDATKNDVNVAETRTGVSKAQLNKADAIIKLKETTIDQQLLKLSYTKIYAPCNGQIGKRNVDPGQYVQAGTPLFTVINDEDYWVVANFKETQIHHMKLGDEVEIKIDAYPDLVLKGKIISFSDATGAKFSLLPPDNATGNFVKVTQRIPVKIVIEDGAKYKDKLHAGMSLDVSVAY